MLYGVVNAVDGFAMAMVVILVLSLGVVALLVTGIYRSGKRRESEVEKLLEELRQEGEDSERHPASPSGGEERAPWEREDDWWKKS
jgi:FtsZ-interacting cell division protein ZipA